MLQLYDDAEVKLNDVVEVVGVLRWAPQPRRWQAGQAKHVMSHSLAARLYVYCGLPSLCATCCRALYDDASQQYGHTPPFVSTAVCLSWRRRTCSRSRAARYVWLCRATACAACVVCVARVLRSWFRLEPVWHVANNLLCVHDPLLLFLPQL